MNREIKSRVWDEIDKKMYYTGECKLSIDLFGHIFDDESDEPTRSRNYRMKLLRGTGYKDNNDLEIYEGDIFKIDYNDVVEYLEVCFGEYNNKHMYEDRVEGDGLYFKIYQKRKSGEVKHYIDNFNYYDFDIEDCEVFANKYENPELLSN
jgi:uncharacterized phage protein (TIGR01671 family)